MTSSEISKKWTEVRLVLRDRLTGHGRSTNGPLSSRRKSISPIGSPPALPTCVPGWLNAHQQALIEYLQEEVRVLKSQLGKLRASPTMNSDGWLSEARPWAEKP
jgi:hypothetical protein